MAELTWVAQYNDGTQLSQRQSDGTKNDYEDIDRSKLEVFHLTNEETSVSVLSILFDGDGEKLVWTRRIKMTLGQEPQVFHILGKKGHFILAVSEDTGAILARDNFKDDGLFYEVMQNNG